jgi:hypothetical protein
MGSDVASDFEVKQSRTRSASEALAAAAPTLAWRKALRSIVLSFLRATTITPQVGPRRFM